ncbi:MAG: DUF1648 domain-containing protein [Vescimonas sp.]
MLKKNKIKVIISSIIILLPALFGIIMWNDLPDIITTHWGADGNADGLSGKVFAVFGTPIILLIFHFVCLLFTSLDKKQKDQNQKALGMVFLDSSDYIPFRKRNNVSCSFWQRI